MRKLLMLALCLMLCACSSSAKPSENITVCRLEEPVSVISLFSDENDKVYKIITVDESELFENETLEEVDQRVREMFEDYQGLDVSLFYYYGKPAEKIIVDLEKADQATLELLELSNGNIRLDSMLQSLKSQGMKCVSE